jgi:hypothetical protein
VLQWLVSNLPHVHALLAVAASLATLAHAYISFNYSQVWQFQVTCSNHCRKKSTLSRLTNTPNMWAVGRYLLRNKSIESRYHKSGGNDRGSKWPTAKLSSRILVEAIELLERMV